MNEDLSAQITKAVKEAFAADVEGGRYVDISRVPLLCQAVIGLEKKLDKLVTKEEFWPVKTLVFSFVGLTLLAVFGALVALVVK